MLEKYFLTLEDSESIKMIYPIQESLCYLCLQLTNQPNNYFINFHLVYNLNYVTHFQRLSLEYMRIKIRIKYI